MENISVFISYSHDSEEHKKWVLKLASDLRSHGVNAIIDQFDLRIGSDLRFFMENGLSNSAFVICVCSESYNQKFNSGCGGSGYEGMIITQPLLTKANAEFVIPIIRNNSSLTKVPVAFGSKVYIDFSDDTQYVSKYTELLRRISGEDTKIRPQLGESPFSNSLSSVIDIKTKIEDILYHSQQMEGVVTFRFDNNNGKYIIGTGEYAFTTRWSRSGNDSIYAYGNIGYNEDAIDIPNYEDLLGFNFTSNARIIRKGQIVIIQNEHKHFAALKLGAVKSSSHGYPYDEMIFEYHIFDSHV